MPEYRSETEAKQGELLHDALEIEDPERDTHPNQLYTLRTRVLNLDTEETQYIIDAVVRAKNRAVARALAEAGGDAS